MIELKSGTLIVDVTTDEYYAVLDAAIRQLASTHVGRALSLFLEVTPFGSTIAISRRTYAPARLLLFPREPSWSEARPMNTTPCWTRLEHRSHQPIVKTKAIVLQGSTD